MSEEIRNLLHAVEASHAVPVEAPAEAPVAYAPADPLMFQEETIIAEAEEVVVLAAHQDAEALLPAEAIAEADIQEALAEEAVTDFHQDAVSLMRGFFPEESTEIVEDFFAPEAVAEEQYAPAPFAAEAYLLTLVPAEARPPAEEGFAPDPDYVIAGIAPGHPIPFHEGIIDPAMLIDPVGEGTLTDAGIFPHVFAPPLAFPVSMISRLQAGKYYLQIAAYSNVESVQYELIRLDRIDSSLTREVVVMRGENPEHGTVYQVLIGPLNLGESGALLQRFRSTTHRDAFIRAGS